MLKNLLNRILSSPPPPPPAPAPAPAPSLGTIAAAAFGSAPAAAPAAPPSPSPEALARADALVAEGNALEDAGQLAQAEARYREAVAAAQGYARTHLNLGIVLAARDDSDGAAAAYEQVLAIDPRHPFGHYNYARLAFLRGDLARAASLLAVALQVRPEFPQALILQAELQDALDQPRQAAESLQAALRLDASNAGAWFNLARICLRTDSVEGAEDAVRRALEIEPDNMAALELLVLLLRQQGFAREALVPLRRLIAQDPASWPHRSLELLLMNFDDGVPADALFRRHVEFGADLERAVPVRFDRWRERGDPGRPLRVGYLSADFVMHPVTLFLVPVLEHHDRTQVEVFCYSFGARRDPITERVRALSDHWRDVAALSDTELSDAIHADGIDVLVDLMGHTGQPRLGVFCQRPAPVQVGWLGYLNTTGLTRMDFRLSDVRCDPPAVAQPLHTERLFALPVSQWGYQPAMEDDLPAQSPLERNGHITFGSFNSAPKITPSACRRWAQVMLRVPASRLLVADIVAERKRAAIRREFAALGVAEDRVEFPPRVALGEYLKLYHRVDIALDAYPYGGGTTTLDSLWMGTPVVAAHGDTPVSRSAASILSLLGMEDWIAPTIDAFVDVAVARATDSSALSPMRRGLRSRMRDSLLTDLPRFTRDLEAAYRQMWAARMAARSPIGRE